MLNPDAHKLLPILMLGGILFNIGALCCIVNGNGLVTEDMGTGKIANYEKNDGKWEITYYCGRAAEKNREVANNEVNMCLIYGELFKKQFNLHS